MALPFPRSLSQLASAPALPHILGPFRASSVNELYGPRGLGKTMFHLELAWTVASGKGVLTSRWAPSAPGGVVVVDGEMPLGDLNTRIHGMARGREGIWHVFSKDDTPEGVIQLLDAGVREDYFSAIAALKPSLVIFDNLASLTPGRREADSDQFSPLALWFKSLAALPSSPCVIFVHHEGKTAGNQRGTSAHEDLADLCVRLVPPVDWVVGTDARFTVTFTKSRARNEKDVAPFDFHLTPKGWVIGADSSNTLYAAFLDHMEACKEFVYRDIMHDLGCSKATVYRFREHAEGAGDWNPSWWAPRRHTRRKIIVSPTL